MAIRTKVSGTWKDVYKVFTKVSGAWKEVTELNAKISSAWKIVGIGLVSTNRVLLLDANDYSGSGNWLDTSGSNNHGTLSNVNHVSSRDRDYFSMNEATRDGGNQYISLASGAVNPNNSFTIGFWVRINTKQPHITTRTNTFISNLSADSALQLRDKTAGLEVVKSFQFSSAQNIFSNSALDSNEIYNIVFVRDNSTNPDTFKVYVNGTQTNPSTGSTMGTFTDNESTFVAPQILGRNYSNVGNDNESLNGRFYHVVAYDAALSSAQILQNYNALKGRYVGDAACPLNLENLEVYLNAGISTSLTGTNNTTLSQGTIWHDLSGQYNNFGFGTNSSTTTTPKYSTDSGSYTITRPTSITSDTAAAVYLAAHADLINAFGTNIASAKQHWTNHGYNEGRHISFDVHAYLELNTDLRNFSNPAYYTDHQAAALHFAGHITTEDRAMYPKAAIKPSLMGFGHLDIDGQAGHARSALNADFFKFGVGSYNSGTGEHFSIGVWFKADDYDYNNGIYSCGAKDHVGSFELVTRDTGTFNQVVLLYHLAFAIGSNNYNYSQYSILTSSGNLDVNNWHYCVIVVKRGLTSAGAGLTMYIDGIESVTTTNALVRNNIWGNLREGGTDASFSSSGNGLSGADVSATDADNVFRIGTNRKEDDHLDGRIGQFHLWKGKALDRQEVLAAYNETKHKYGHPDNLYRNG